MKHASLKSTGFLVVAALVTAFTVSSRSGHRPHTQEVATGVEALPVVTSPLLSPPPGMTGKAIVETMRLRERLRRAELEEYSDLRVYEVRDRSGKVLAREAVTMHYLTPGREFFTTQAASGSWLVRDLVFKRLIESEKITSDGREHHDSAISPGNYHFTLVGVQDIGPYHCFVLRAKPRRKGKYLFVGTLWINKQDYGVVRIAGHPARRPSFWIEHADFVRQYHDVEGFWLPTEDVTFVKVRFFGQRVLVIAHRTDSINGRSLAGVCGQESLSDPRLLLSLPSSTGGEGRHFAHWRAWNVNPTELQNLAL